MRCLERQGQSYKNIHLYLQILIESFYFDYNVKCCFSIPTY